MPRPGEIIIKKKYAYVIASTLNQMVNYIPLNINFDEIELDNIYNVTLEVKKGERVKENALWDNYFEKVIKHEFNSKTITDIKIEQEDWLSVDKTIEEFKVVLNSELKPIFWNITGGQRPFLLAVIEFTKNRPNDVIAYIEGNTKGIRLFNKINKKLQYKIENLKIKTAFQLMGYDIKGIKEDDTKPDVITKCKKYVELWNIYIKDEKLRKAFVESNKAIGDIKNVKSLISDNTLHFILENREKKSYPFGYILEDMVFAVLYDTFKDRIAEISHSVKLEFVDENLNKEVAGKQLDEFDILLLTKSGQLYNFECKSGGMCGDVAKSTKYSTYAIAGVYGKPILITPLTQKEIDELKYLDDAIYVDVKSAVRSARRATFDVWGIDELQNDIVKDKLK